MLDKHCIANEQRKEVNLCDAYFLPNLYADDSKPDIYIDGVPIDGDGKPEQEGATEHKHKDGAIDALQKAHQEEAHKIDVEEIQFGQLIQRTLPPCEQCLKDADVPKSDMPPSKSVNPRAKDAEVVEKFFAKTPSKIVNPDEVVAMGAEIQRRVLDDKADGLVLIDETPLSQGIKTLGEHVKVLWLGKKLNTMMPESELRTDDTNHKGKGVDYKGLQKDMLSSEPKERHRNGIEARCIATHTEFYDSDYDCEALCALTTISFPVGFQLIIVEDKEASIVVIVGGPLSYHSQSAQLSLSCICTQNRNV